MDEEVRLLLSEAPAPDLGAADAVAERARNVLRPLGALERLDEIASWLASWQRTSRPSVDRPSLIVFVADHGVTAEGVSAYPSEVTAAMLKALREGVATATAMAKGLGVAIEVIDAGVGNPTNNFVNHDALTPDRFRECFEIGRRAVAELEADLLLFGDMGIGNTAAASAVTAALLNLPAENVTGRGTGIDDVTFARKKSVVETARRRTAGSTPLEILRQVGGSELAAISGAAVEARLRSIPVVLDGFVVTASVAPLEVLQPGALDHCIAGHRSPEPGHGLLLERLAKQPIVDLELRLGEGTGALLAVPIIRAGAAAITDVATFEEWGLEGR